MIISRTDMEPWPFFAVRQAATGRVLAVVEAQDIDGASDFFAAIRHLYSVNGPVQFELYSGNSLPADTPTFGRTYYKALQTIASKEAASRRAAGESEMPRH